MLRDRVEQTSNTAGAGAYTLDGTVTGKRAFANAFANGDTVIYTVVQGASWECNEGVLTIGSPSQLSRVRLIGSSTGSAIVWPDATAKQIFCDAPAELFGPLSDQFAYAVAGGTATALTASVPVPFAVFRSGAKLMLRITADSTGAGTLTTTAAGVTGPAKAIQKANGVPLNKLELVAGAVMLLAFDTTADAWIIENGINISSGKHLVPIPANAMRGPTTNGAQAVNNEMATNKVAFLSFDFDTSTKEFAVFVVPMPQSYDGGVIQFRARWTAASGSGGVAWSLQALARQDDDAIDTAYGTAVTVTDTLTTALDEDVTALSGNVTPAGSPAGGKNMYFRVAREVADGADTLAVDAKLIALDIFMNTKAGNDN